MKYILKYKDKEDFLEDNPKEENKLPVVWCYPEERVEENFFRKDLESELELDKYISILSYNESGTTDITSIVKNKKLFFVSGPSGGDVLFLKSGMTIEPGQWGIDETAQGGIIPLNRSSVVFLNVNPITGHTPETIIQEHADSDYAYRTYGCSAFTSDSWYLACTKSEKAYTADSKDIVVEETLSHWPKFFNDFNPYAGFKMPSGTPVSSYTVFAKVIDRINGEEAHLPGALFEPVNDGFRVKQFLLLPNDDLSSCGYTATANQWFGLYVPTEEPGPGPKDKSGESKTGSIPSEQPGEDEQEENVSPFVFGEFYTEGETGVATSGDTSMYFTIFYRTDESSVTPSDGKGKTVRTPYFALTKMTSGKDFVFEWEGYYDIYSAITYQALYGEGAYNETQNLNITGRLTGLCGSITMIDTGSDNKDYVTKVEPGFAYVKDPMSVYYNKLKKVQSNNTSNQTNNSGSSLNPPFIDFEGTESR